MRNLEFIDSRYRASKTKMEPLYYSKLAVLELSGWIEITIDDLALRAVRKKVRDPAAQNQFKNLAVKPVYGFRYAIHFRRILCSAVGEIVVASVERKMDERKRSELEAELDSLMTSRNNLAHTYVKGVTQQIDAPSQTIQRFKRIYGGLKEFERQVFAMI